MALARTGHLPTLRVSVVAAYDRCFCPLASLIKLPSIHIYKIEIPTVNNNNASLFPKIGCVTIVFMMMMDDKSDESINGIFGCRHSYF